MAYKAKMQGAISWPNGSYIGIYFIVFRTYFNIILKILKNDKH